MEKLEECSNILYQKDIIDKNDIILDLKKN